MPYRTPEVGRLVRARREAAGLTVAQLAREARIAPATVRAVEDGAEPTLRVFAVLSSALAWTVDDVVEAMSLALVKR